MNDQRLASVWSTRTCQCGCPPLFVSLGSSSYHILSQVAVAAEECERFHASRSVSVTSSASVTDSVSIYLHCVGGSYETDSGSEREQNALQSRQAVVSSGRAQRRVWNYYLSQLSVSVIATCFLTQLRLLRVLPSGRVAQSGLDCRHPFRRLSREYQPASVI